MGILVRSGGVVEVVPLSAGRIGDVAVEVGDTVHEGQVVARVAQPELNDRLLQLKRSISSLKERQEQLRAHQERDAELQRRYLDSERKTMEQAAASARRSLDSWSERILIQARLAEEGLLTRQTLLASRQQRDLVHQSLNEADSRLAEIALRELESRNRRQEEVRARQLEIEEQERAAVALAHEIRIKAEVTAPCAGRVLEVMTEEGALIGPGQPVLTLDRLGRTVKELEAVIYVPSVYGKQIREGMTALISPTTVKQQEYGLMIGSVTYVSSFPATSRGMQRMLKNERLVAALSGSDAPYEIRADLVPDPETPSQYRWSSSQGPPLKIQSGTLASGKIVVSRRRPIDMVIPWLREHTGL
jgi:HlyD family secretion protein